MLSTVDFLIKVACFKAKEINFYSIQTSRSDVVNTGSTMLSLTLNLPRKYETRLEILVKYKHASLPFAFDRY